MLHLWNFEKKYGDRRIIAVESLAFDTGIHWIRGENGTGKSSFFKALAGIIPSTGTVYFDDGISMLKNPVEYRRRVNFSEAEPIYPPFLTGLEIFRFAARAKGVSATQQHQMIENFGIGGYLKQTVGTYSSGMAKRLSLSIGFLGQPQVIILDEPLITLDTATRDTLTGLIKEWISRTEAIFLISAHEDLTDSYLPITESLRITNQTLRRE